MRTLSTLLLCVALGARAEPLPPSTSPAPAPKGRTAQASAQDGRLQPQDENHAGEAASLRARIDKEAIRAAIAGLPTEADAYPRRHEADTLSATPAQSFARDFAASRLPDCLHSEGLRNQPTFFLTGFLALPFIAVAKVRGVCR
ncbi:hypothetical protein G4G28_17510 [Massilia sp. Dwa41.01b]|uniref:hypothetical protein n=1 Tax=unclassified Massilia TaxID=2609279 RepID=UPI001600B943|nr:MULTISPECIES: hypothetical protein [unclassified Massilia]QNA89833.1 hypothetical protein G4G28_17510 [Massilia sp. Dwa41.01b]QNB00725.1 hypothetical protein G4G31_21075 [Massilia sp. Se16.2.3]